MEIREIKKSVMVDKMFYVAEDGKEFDTYFDCAKYVKEIEYTKRCAELKKIEYKASMDGRTPLDGCEYMECHDYRWFRPKTLEEIDLLNKIYMFDNHPLDEKDIGEWVCIEADDIEYYREFAWNIRLKDSIEHIKWFVEQFGYEINIKESEQK